VRQRRNWLLFLIVVLTWGSNWSALKSGLSYVDPVNFLLHRFMLSTLALFPLAVTSWQKIPRDGETWGKLVLMGMVGASGQLLTYMGLVHEKSGISAVLTYTQPLFVFCMAVAFLKEGAGTNRLLGILVGFSGVVVLSFKGADILAGIKYSFVLLILGAVLWAVSIVFYKKFLLHVDAVVTSVTQLGVGALMLSAPAAFRGFYFPFAVNYLLIILFVAIGASSLALTVWIFLLRGEEATVLSSSSFIIPMAALILGWLLLGESVEPRSLAGAALIVVGVYLVNRV